MAELKIAWLSRGRLLVQSPADNAPREIESEFAIKALERRQRDASVNSWKSRSGVWGNMGAAPGFEAPWAAVEQQRMMRVSAIVRGDHADQVYYVLDMGHIGGLFSYDLQKGYETRLMHREGFVSGSISRHPSNGKIAAAMRRSDGTKGIVVGENDGRFLKDVTMSDAIDEAPSWLGDGSDRLVFQSSGIGRDENGVAVGQSPYRLELLDLETKEATCLLEDNDHDLLQPRMTKNDTLFFIRRPWKPRGQERVDFKTAVKDVLMFPVRLGVAVVHFCNVFSMMFSGKPLMTANGPDRPGNGKPRMHLWGHMVDAQQALARAKKKGEEPCLVPDTWKLVRRTADGNESVIAESVLAFDVDSDGQVVYTTGQAILLHTENGPRKVADGDLVEQVAVLQ